MQHKTISGGIKLKDTGEVEAVFSRFNVVDHDGDVTLPGAFKEGQAVRLSAFNHTSWGGVLPVGKGTIHNEADHAIFRGSFFMDTTAGKDHHATVKALGELGEWSYGFDVVEASHGQHDGRDVQFLKSLDVTEVSPVLRGAGIGTRTLSVKSREVGDMTDEEVAEQAQKACQAIAARGLEYPSVLVDSVKTLLVEEESWRKLTGELHLIAALNNVNIEGGS